MSLDKRWEPMRSLFGALSDDEIIQRGDETACASMLAAGYDDWDVMEDADFSEFFGRTVRDMNDPKHNNEMDVSERLFRRSPHSPSRKDEA